jgi:hypothetical protein
MLTLLYAVQIACLYMTMNDREDDISIRYVTRLYQCIHIYLLIETLNTITVSRKHVSSFSATASNHKNVPQEMKKPMTSNKP